MLICYTFQKEAGRGWIRKRGQRAEIICNFDDLHKCTLIAIKVWIKMQTSMVIGKFSLLYCVETFWYPFTRQCIGSETLVTIKGRVLLVNLNHFICTMHNACNLILKHTSSLLKSSCSFFLESTFPAKNNIELISVYFLSTNRSRFYVICSNNSKKQIDFKNILFIFWNINKTTVLTHIWTAFCIDCDILALTAVIVCNTEEVTLRIG